MMQSAVSSEYVVDTLNRKRIYLSVKRTLDIVMSMIGIVTLCIPMLLIALLIKLESSGPVIFVHQRIGKDKRPLPLLKFRTMYSGAEQMIGSFSPEQRAEWEKNFKLEHDPRITRIGKFLRRTSLDELPQLINILRGELSIVGPRPVVTEELLKYGDKQSLFLSVTPGLTGYWQAYARSTCTYEERIEMELHYAKNANFLWDIKIILATFGAVLRGHGAK